MSNTTFNRTINIKLPQRIKKVNQEDLNLNPFFEVEKQELFRRDGVGISQIALVNKDTNKTVGVVSKDYNLTTHQEASDVVKNIIESIGLTGISAGAQVASKGAKFFETIRFDSLAFNPASGSPSTALDNKGLTRDDIIPIITIRNSYDRSTAISWSYGAYRLICGNGMAVLQHEDKLSFTHNQKLDLSVVSARLTQNIEKSIKAVEEAYTRLNNVGGQDFLVEVLNSTKFSDKFKVFVLDKLGSHVSLDETTATVDKKSIKTIRSVFTPLSGYALYNVLTDVASHEIVARGEQEKISKQIAQVFQVVA
jgi:hypothetical protein